MYGCLVKDKAKIKDMLKQSCSKTNNMTTLGFEPVSICINKRLKALCELIDDYRGLYIVPCHLRDCHIRDQANLYYPPQTTTP